MALSDGAYTWWNNGPTGASVTIPYVFPFTHKAGPQFQLSPNMLARIWQAPCLNGRQAWEPFSVIARCSTILSPEANLAEDVPRNGQ